MTITNISGKLLNLKMPMGTVFIPDAEEEQTLIKSEDEMFALSNEQKKVLQFHGYFTELHDNGCDEGIAFTMNQTNNSKL